jgi:DNA sulfur modification protein DndB
LGYQRILKADRIGSISRAIQKGQIIAFPNSIIIYSPEKLYKQEVTDKKPKHVKIDVPNYHCACRIIDGQHRLLAFSKLDEVMQKNAFLPIIAFEDIKKEDEMKMFIDINLNQKKIDSNLLLLLKSDSNWEQGSKEYFEKIAVKIALKLNENSPIQQKIYLGTADEKKRTDITLTTLVAVFIKNNLVGGKIHLYQKSDDDIDGPYKEIKKCFELLNRCLDVKSIKYHQFIYGNKGLRILFRYIQVMERNTKCGNIQVEKTLWFSKFCEIIDDPYLSKLLDYYGDGGATAAVDQIILSLKRNNSEVMSKLSSDLRTLKG